MVTGILAAIVVVSAYLAGFYRGSLQPLSDPRARKFDEALAKNWAFVAIIFKPGVSLSEFDEDAEGTYCQTYTVSNTPPHMDADSLKMTTASLLASEVTGEDYSEERDWD